MSLGPMARAILGAFLKPEFRQQVRTLPSTSLRDYSATAYDPPNLVIISDVIPHGPVAARAGLFALWVWSCAEVPRSSPPSFSKSTGPTSL
jgi:hypothetical protein